MNPENPENPPAIPPAPPSNRSTGPDESGAVVARAFLGFFAYVGIGWLSLTMRPASLFLVVLLVIAAIVMALKGVWRGFALGVFIGVGITLLLIGACFALFAMK